MSSRIEQLSRLADLKERGLLTPEEFASVKARLLAEPASHGWEGPHDQARPAARDAMPESNLVWAVLATVLCFLPFGVVAIVKASQVQTLWHTGQHQGARDAAASASGWSLASAGVGLVLLVIIVALEASHR